MDADSAAAATDHGDWRAALKRKPAGSVVRAKDLQQWSDGEGYLAAAKQVLELARQKASELVQAERARGHKEGWEDGSKEVFSFLAQTKLAVDAYYAQLETNLRELAVQVIEQVVGDLDASDAVASAVRKALATSDPGNEVTLYVAPEVLHAVRKKLEGQLSQSTISTITLRADPKLSATTCMLVSDFCTVDVSIGKQLSLLTESLRASNIGVRE
jgi:type III secretion protein L